MAYRSIIKKYTTKNMMNISFSTSRKERVTRIYQTQFLELLRAYQYDGKERANNLIDQYLKGDKNAEIEKINKGDIDLLISLVQDYLATQQLLKNESSTISTDIREISLAS